MDTNKFVFVTVVGQLLACLPTGYPPVEKNDIEQDAVVIDPEVVQDSSGDVFGDKADDAIMAVDLEAESGQIYFDIDGTTSDKDAVSEAKKSDGHLEVALNDDEAITAGIDAEVGEQKKDTLFDDGGLTTPDDGAVGSNETAVIPDEDISADDGALIDMVQIDTIECPEGYYYDPAENKCVSFCGADKYFEKKIGKCLLYPCPACDLNGPWSLAILDSESMTFTYYSLTIIQTVSYLDAQLIIATPPEVANCLGTLENKNFSLSCKADAFTLILTSETASSDEIVGFYSYSYKDGKFKNGPFNMDKSN